MAYGRTPSRAPPLLIPDFPRGFVSRDAIPVCVHGVHAWYTDGELHRRERLGEVSRVANPFHPLPSLQRGWVGVVGCVYEATGPKLKGIPRLAKPRNGARGEGVQRSLTSERPYQRVILLVDAGVATSRRHWFARDSLGVAIPLAGGVVASLATITAEGKQGFRSDASKFSMAAIQRSLSAVSPSLALSLSLSLPLVNHSDARRRATSIATDCSRPLSWIPLDLFSATLQESKVSSVD